MKKHFKLTLLFLLPFFVSAQKFSDAKTFQKAIELAQLKQKPILLIIILSHELEDKYKINQTIEDPAVVKKMKANFVVFETEKADTAMRKTIAKYKVTTLPAFLFMHPNQEVFHHDFGSSSSKMKYLNMMDKALILSKEKSLSQIAEAYSANKSDTTLLRQLINVRKKNGITDNSQLIEDYANQLKIADFNDYKTVLFILEAGPRLDGNAYKFGRTNPAIFDKIYKSEPLQKRVAINNAIINNSYAAAVLAKDKNKAWRVADFARGVWGNDREKGEKAYELRMLNFYNATKDTANYFISAINYYDRFYMRLSADSIKKLDAKNRAERFENMRKQMSNANTTVSKGKTNNTSSGKPIIHTELTQVSSPSNMHSTDLNNVAYRFYQTGTKNVNHLTKAMTWSKRAIELDSSWPNYNTLAYIYYALGFYKEALATQQLAIDFAKKQKTDAQSLAFLAQHYEKMKNKTL